MFRTRTQAGLVAAGLFAAWALVAQASSPSEECRDGAAHCREAFNKLEKCQHTQDATKDGGTDAAKAESKADGCGVERAATDSACKMTNESCVRDGSGHTPPPHKD